MKNTKRISAIFGAFAVAGLLVAALFAVSVGSANAQEPTSDTNCIYAATAAVGNPLDNCTANDFGITDIQLLEVITPCSGEGTTATVRMRLTAFVGSPERYDVGFFINTDGTGDAIGDANTTPSCFHTYLRPLSPDGNVTYSPTSGVGPFWQGEPADTGDFCADSEGNNIDLIFDTVESFDIVCNDLDNDGQVDVHACASYDNNAADTCANVGDAIPGTPAKCGCTLVNIPFTPTGITLNNISTGSGSSVAAPILAAFGLLAVATFVVLRRVRATGIAA